jgi:hypothetical protein
VSLSASDRRVAQRDAAAAAPRNQAQAARAENQRLEGGICPEMAEMLKDQHFATDAMRHLRKMKAGRQIECAELMISLNNYSLSYASPPPPDWMKPPTEIRDSRRRAASMARGTGRLNLYVKEHEPVE